jgi:hypothetical protein
MIDFKKYSSTQCKYLAGQSGASSDSKLTLKTRFFVENALPSTKQPRGLTRR